MPKTDVEINEMMERVAPELGSVYAKYPLALPGWLMPGGTGPNSAPGYIKADTESCKENYVYGDGLSGIGHYHILTRDAYVNLTTRLKSTTPIGWCCFAGSRKAADEHYDVTQICYNRSISSVPDDAVAAREALSASKDTAQAVYLGKLSERLVLSTWSFHSLAHHFCFSSSATMNEQLVVGAVMLAT